MTATSQELISPARIWKQDVCKSAEHTAHETQCKVNADLLLMAQRPSKCIQLFETPRDESLCLLPNIMMGSREGMPVLSDYWHRLFPLFCSQAFYQPTRVHVRLSFHCVTSVSQV